MVVGNVHQRTDPQLHRAEDAAEAPVVLILQVASVAPAIDLHAEPVVALTNVRSDIELGGRHRILTISHPLAVHPDIHCRVDATEVEDEILREHFLRHIKEPGIRAHGIAVLVGRPVLRRLGGHPRAILHEGIVDVDIDGCAVALRLPVAGHGNLAPLAHVVVLLIEFRRPLVGIAAPMEVPLPVKTDNLLAFLLARGKLQRGVIRQFVDA